MPGRSSHSEEQRRAVVAARVEHGLSAAEAVAAAAAGELPGAEGLERSAISESSARAHAGDARRERPTRPRDEDTEASLGVAEARLRRILDRERERLEGQEEPNLERVRWLARVARELEALTRQRRRGHVRRVSDADRDDLPAGDFIDGLAAAQQPPTRNGASA
jgi:hypothetical protein